MTAQKKGFRISVNWTTVLTTVVISLLMFFGSYFFQSWQSKQTESDIKELNDFKHEQKEINVATVTTLQDMKETQTETKEMIKDGNKANENMFIEILKALGK